MKKFLMLVAILVAASAVAALIGRDEDTDSVIEEADDGSTLEYLGV